MKRFLIWGGGGVLFGGVLLVLGFMSAGTGHGCYVPIGLAAGPLTLISLRIRDAIVAMAAPPIVWGAYGLLCAWWGRSGKAASRGRKLLILHNALGLLVISPFPGTEYADWGYFSRVWPAAALCLALYAAGQVLFWRFLPKLDLR